MNTKIFGMSHNGTHLGKKLWPKFAPMLNVEVLPAKIFSYLVNNFVLSFVIQTF